MPPRIYGLDTLENEAEKIVAQAMRFLPEESIVYLHPKLVYGEATQHPDIVIVYREWGVVVLEVKGWFASGIVDLNAQEACLRSSKGDCEWKTSPVEQARKAAHVLVNILKRDEELRNWAGKLDFSYAYGGVLPFLNSMDIRRLEEQWGESYLLGKEDILPERIVEKISRIRVPFRKRLSDRQVDAIRAALDSTMKIRDRISGEFRGIYDKKQESIIKEPLARRSFSDSDPNRQISLLPSPDVRARLVTEELPEEARGVISSKRVRLVRGFAGTGKTDVLVLRARYLHEHYPDLDILVTTFNHPLYEERLKPELEDLAPRVEVKKFDTLCASIYRKKHGVWRDPQDTRGLVASMAKEFPLIRQLGIDFVTQEFIWMKETGRTSRRKYVNEARSGRGIAGRRMGRGMKEKVFGLFEEYQRRLKALPAHDWVDLHEKTLEYLAEGVRPDRVYDYILVDEAQHFAPAWMRILQYFLKAGGDLFLCDDPSQSVYRYYSWLQKGVEVRGRTRWLRKPYRNTRQIFEAAYALISGNPISRNLLSESGEDVQPNFDGLSEGPRPEVHRFPSWEAEREFVKKKIGSLVQAGVRPSEIAILHDKKYVLERYKSELPQGVKFYEARRQTGLEYRAVFIPKVQDLFEREVGVSVKEDHAKQQIKLYMLMTRSRHYLYLLYEGKWPKVAEPIRSYVEWVDH